MSEGLERALVWFRRDFKTYAAPIVDHAEARQRTLERYSVVKRR